MSDIPRRTASRTAKLASLPLGVAGRAAAGWGRRIAGGDREQISAQMMAKSAEQLFAVLGELKGGAMKFGQALSVFEAAVPDELAEPYREALTKLQTAAPPMPTADVHRMLAEQFGRGWRSRFREFDEVPAAAASIGQVHRAVWRDGRDVAVKVQYPGAEEAVLSDLRQLSRMSRLLQPLAPGMDIKPLIAELRERMVEELDYRDEADNQRAFASVYADDPEIRVPRVVASAPKAMVSEWVTGRRLGDVIRQGTQEERDRAGELLAGFHYSAPYRVHLLHSDPHPGNFQILDDGRMLVVDFGAVARLPEGLPRPLTIMTKFALENRPADLIALLRDEGFLRAGTDVSADDVLAYLAPFTEPLHTERFRFTRRWLQGQAERVGDLRSPEFDTGRALNLPPQYLLVHRVTLGTLGVLCQLEADVPLRGIVGRWQPELFTPAD
ncbi:MULTISPECIES: AarF/ABC1/UbiB kinase family protein [Pseudonocardia]|uniref:Predicted unusual protein kinase regulating ubiquinone biosynthesis, AarF/ABC1/UbiB family n=1 Tax=Pseudonocardia oroxyli TaxID=366584 RepID=A0A1G7QU01_PSEOR|nr:MULTISPECIES: AarF/ABC1/UbiB kinase family protein [Pseudonocardia]MCF7551060.1 AarF/ABC1/UbiB kinase family protein [Pseudonocardia sp. WMMC193]SDG01987.1 Predicted unusual protein kinase regulating ubiquinone biosynthesis, AarF/ABC1/UbiB family [Pseudonocardia oroxyli]